MKVFGAHKSLIALAVALGVLGFAPGRAAFAQTTPVAPTVIPVSGQILTAAGQPRTGSALLVISLYEAQNDPAPRWIEHQQVTLDQQGRYSIQFGSTQTEGLPADLFTGAASTRWIGVAIENEAEQPRVMLVSVPYAAKAASAETLAGKPASEFVLASTLREDVRAAIEDERLNSETVRAEAVTLNYLQKGAGAGTTTDSGVFETAAGNVGVGTTTPAAKLHVLGTIATGNSDVARAGFTHENIGAGLHGRLHLQSNRGAGLVTGIILDHVGNVGVGTMTPAANFHVLGTIATGNSDVARAGFTYESIGLGTHGQLHLQSNTGAGLATGLTLDHVGNVGVGTTRPESKLHVAGGATISGDVVVNGNIAAKYQDVAEWVDAAEPLEAGTLVVIDQSRTNRVLASGKAYDGRVAGAVSPQPGLILGEAREGGVLVAQSGRVKVKADARFGAIKPGDLLVSSPTKGHVMRSKPVKIGDAIVHRPGTIVGKALEALPKGKGEILVLLTLQ